MQESRREISKKNAGLLPFSTTESWRLQEMKMMQECVEYDMTRTHKDVDEKTILQGNRESPTHFSLEQLT